MDRFPEALQPFVDRTCSQDFNLYSTTTTAICIPSSSMASSTDNLTKLNDASTTKIYKPIPDDGIIRVVKLHTDEGEPIECSLVIRKHNDISMIYRSFSYVWGSQENLNTIRLCRETFYVTRNLSQVPRRIRDLHDKDVLICIDALCLFFNRYQRNYTGT
jgi:hypothetical protein